MNIRVKSAAALVIALTASSCATKGALHKVEAEQRAALEAERAERMAGDEQLAAELAQLRADLQALRNDFGARISAVEKGLSFAMPVHFSYNDATVQSNDFAALDRFAQVVNRHYTGSVITVEGFADPAGSRAYNQRLSAKRADAVRSHLLQRNIVAQVRSVGYGEDRQVVPNAQRNQPGAELNRRVVFVI
ncbi:MAG TPA: OmpA family protein, partial [Longimicrobiales bacterium]